MVYNSFHNQFVDLKVGRYTICQQEHLVILYFSGYVNIEELLYFIGELIKDPKYSKNYDVLIDFRCCIPVANKQNIDKYIQFIKDNKSFFDSRKGAYLTGNPDAVVATTLFQNMLNNIPIKSGIFSTLESVIHWINNPLVTEPFLQTELDQLRSRTDNTLKP